MIVNLDNKQFRNGLNKLCKVASLTATDSYVSQIKFNAKNKIFYGEVINETKTQSLIVKFDETVCSIQEPGSCCVPAKALQQTAELLLGDTIELSSDNNMLNIKSLPYKKQNELQSIEGLNPDQWLSIGKMESDNVLELHRDFFLDVGRFTANGCSTDKSKAPLTAIHITIFTDGRIQCTATDYVRISLYDCKNGIKDGKIENDLTFMLPVDVAKKIPQIFEKDIDVIKAKIDSKRISLQGGNIIFGFSTEAGVDRYPPLRSYLFDDMNVNCRVELPNLMRIAGLLSAVAPKSPCNITFNQGEVCFDAQENRNKSRQLLETETCIVKNDITLPQDIKIAVYDLISSLSIPTADKINIGLVSIKNNAFGHLLEIRQATDDIMWRQIILKARDIIPEEAT